MSLRVDITKAQGAFTLRAKFDAPEGITVLFGPSGSGKTTLINAIAGLSTPDTGEITLEDTPLFDSARGINLPTHKRGLGYVFQEARLFPHMSVERNLRYAARVQGLALDANEYERITALLGIGHLLARRPARLSGGEAQRVALGRALLSRPRILLADEPLAALDRKRKEELLPYFERLRDETGIPIVYVTHSPSELGRLASRVVALEAGEVVRVMSGPEALADPDLMPGGVRGVGALLSAMVAAHHPDGLSELSAGEETLLLPRVPQEIGQTIRLRISAQDVILSRTKPVGLSALNALKGRVTHVREGAGPGAIVSLETAAGALQARITRRSVAAMGLALGDEVFAIVKTLSVAREDIGPKA